MRKRNLPASSGQINGEFSTYLQKTCINITSTSSMSEIKPTAFENSSAAEQRVFIE